MSQSDLENLSLALVNCTSGNDDVRNQATQFILNFKNQNLFVFLNALLSIIHNQSSPDIAKNYSLILAKQTFNKVEINDPVIRRFEYFEKNCQGLLGQYLTACPPLFSTSPNLSADLFSTVASIIADNNDENLKQILSQLLQQIESVSDYNFIQGALQAIDYIISDSDSGLYPESYQPILFKIFTFIGNQEVPIQIKSLSLKILSSMIYFISDVFQNPQNVETIVSVLKYSINEDQTKEQGYKCLSQIIKYHFPIFASVVNDVIPVSIADLEQNYENEQIVLAIFRMIKKLINRYDDEFDDLRKEVIVKSFSHYFELLLKIAMNHDEKPSEPDTFNSSTESYELIEDIIELIPEIALQPYLQFSQSNIQSPDYRIREMSLSLFRDIVISIDDNNQIIQLISNILHLFPGILDDSQPRVVEISLYLLRTIIKKLRIVSESIQDSNFLQGPFKEINQLISSYSQPLLALLIKEMNYPSVASSICVTLSTIDNLPNYKDVLITMIQCANTKSPDFSNHLLYSISQIIQKTKDYNSLKEILPHFINLVKLAILDPNYHQNQIDILDAFGKSCAKASKYLSPFLPELHPLLVQCYLQTQDSGVLVCLSCLATATRNEFSPCLPQLMELLLQLSERTENNYDLFSLSNSLMELNDGFDLSNYVQKFTEVILNIFNVRKNDLVIYSDFLDVLDIFFRSYFGLLEPAVIPTLRIISEVILLLENVVDDDERHEFIVSVTKFFNTLFDKADPQARIQWFELGCRVFDAASKFVDIESDDDDSKYDISIYATLFTYLFDINSELLNQFLMQNQEAQNFIATMMINDKCKDIMNDVLKDMGVQMNNKEE
ncbi:hypothetical protein M9Y10_004805 [Tritrichomonas musculus]|uniref:Importin N-terminal domain-containing protein n=1 Tax=Tritrichomonas musculus TaxID=1915356 RepID=A0ABR2JK77_9EUKA